VSLLSTFADTKTIPFNKNYWYILIFKFTDMQKNFDTENILDKIVKNNNEPEFIN
jgi:hypothetical protein